MDDRVKQIVRSAVEELIDNTISDRSIRESLALHQSKIHFVPTRYRVMGGLLQALNIKFGNFIEKLLALVVENDGYVQAMPSSGKKVFLSMTARTDTLIDQYITSRQLPDSPDECDELFGQLVQTIFDIEHSSDSGEKQLIRKDIDALFRARDGQIVYLEVKYNDDHDTGKFVDINRKFLKTYAGLLNHLEITNTSEIKPILYYFNPTKRWGPIYTPSTHIYRGPRLFEEYFQIKFADIDQYLRQIGDDERILALFDELYRKVRYEIELGENPFQSTQ